MMYKSGDKVSHKGNLWTVQYELNSMVKIVRPGDSATVPVKQVKFEGVTR